MKTVIFLATISNELEVNRSIDVQSTTENHMNDNVSSALTELQRQFISDIKQIFKKKVVKKGNPNENLSTIETTTVAADNVEVTTVENEKEVIADKNDISVYCWDQSQYATHVKDLKSEIDSFVNSYQKYRRYANRSRKTCLRRLVRKNDSFVRNLKKLVKQFESAPRSEFGANVTILDQ